MVQTLELTAGLLFDEMEIPQDNHSIHGYKYQGIYAYLKSNTTGAC